ncbi:MAG TPA: hypothetical protein VGN17_19505 [Bryobacteraceae bacterium]|jgi:hypothetical protein
MAQFALRQNLGAAKVPPTPIPTPVPIPYPNLPGPVPAGLNPAGFNLGGSPSTSKQAVSRQVGQLGGKPATVGASSARSATGSGASRVLLQINSSVNFFGTNMDLGAAYPDVPMGGKLTDILQFAWAHSLPVFSFINIPMELGVLVFCWMEITFGLIPLAFVYMDASFSNSPLQDFFVYQWLINMPTQISPITMRGGTDGLSLISPPDSLWLPFIPSAPVWPAEGAVFPPNPYLRFFRGGSVPCDASGLSALVGAFV